MKRTLDLLIILLLCPLLVLILPLVAIPKAILDGLPLFYLSERVGKNEVKFIVFKFRTMVLDTEIIQNEVAKYTKSGFEAIPLSSCVYTPAGRVFEKLQMVEIPQLINVLLGQMSFVGYRPLPNSNVSILKSHLGADLIKKRHESIPGITGFAQLIGKRNLTAFERTNVEINEGRFFSDSDSLVTKTAM